MAYLKNTGFTLRANKTSTPHYFNLASSDTQKRPNLRKTSQIPLFGFIAAIGLVASTE